MLRVIKSGLSSLLIAGTAIAAPGGYTKSHGNGVPALKFELPAMPITFSPGRYLAYLVAPRHRTPLGGMCAGSLPRFSLGCGQVHFIEPPPRKSALSDPASALGAAYLKCRAIKAAGFEPRVPVALYPAGYFGDWVHEGVLVADRIEFTDETRLGQIFALLVEAVRDPDERDEFWFEETAPGKTFGDYRRDTGFSPELVFEFVGEVPLRVEISLSERRLLIQGGDKWGDFVLDRWCAAALMDLLSQSSSRGGREMVP